MSVVINMLPSDWARWMASLGARFMPAMQRGVTAGAFRCLPILHTSTRTAPAATAGMPDGAVNTGAYLQAWQAAPIPNGARVYNSRMYSPIVEAGRRPAFVGQQGRRNIEIWVRQKLKIPKAEARHVAFAIGRTMSPRPWGGGKKLHPRLVMNRVLLKMTEAVQQEIAHELWRELTR
jgi:hypothetical protein